MDTNKNWMLTFQWKSTGETETFYFDTKDEMVDFVRTNNVGIERSCYLVDTKLF